MQDIWGVIYANIPLLIASSLIIAVGSAMIAKRGNDLLTIGGVVLVAIGGLAAFEMFYIDGLRWMNAIAGLVLVIVLGLFLIRSAPGWITTIAGVVVLILGTFALSDTYPLNRVDLGGSIGTAFRTGTDQLVDIFQPNSENRRGGNGQNNGSMQR
jgi:hypothetical protein